VPLAYKDTGRGGGERELLSKKIRKEVEMELWWGKAGEPSIVR